MNQTSGKTCPPCYGDCNQGRTCPARTDVFLQCSDCACSSHQIVACGGCPRRFAVTQPGAVEPEREQRPTPHGFPVGLLFVALCLVAAAYVIAELASRGFVWGIRG